MNRIVHLLEEMDQFLHACLVTRRPEDLLLEWSLFVQFQ